MKIRNRLPLVQANTEMKDLEVIASANDTITQLVKVLLMPLVKVLLMPLPHHRGNKRAH